MLIKFIRDLILITLMLNLNESIKFKCKKQKIQDRYFNKNHPMRKNFCKTDELTGLSYVKIRFGSSATLIIESND